MKTLIVNKINALHAWLSKPVIEYTAMLLSLIVVIRWFLLTHFYSVNILYWDQWGFYNALFYNYNWWDTFTYQFGPHRQGVGFVITRIIDDFSSWNTRYISFAVSVLLLLTTIVYLKLKHKLFAQFNYLDAILVLFVLGPSQYSLFAGVPNLSHGSMPALLVSLLALSFFIRKYVVRSAVVLILLFNLVYSGFGIFAAVPIIAYFLIDILIFIKQRFKKQFFLSIFFFVSSILATLSFFYNYNFQLESNSEYVQTSPFWKYPLFVSISYLNMVFSSVKWGWLGLFIVIPLFYVLIIHLRKLFFDLSNWDSDYQRISKIIVFLISFSLLFGFGSAVGRISFGLHEAAASRYICYLVPSLVALYFHFLQSKSNYKISFTYLLLGFALLSQIPRMQMHIYAQGKREWKAHYLIHENIKEADKTSGFKIINDAKAHKLEWKLNYLKENELNLFHE